VKPAALSVEEQRELMASASFQAFLDQSARVVERVLAQGESAEADYLRDYRRGSAGAVSGAENKGIHLIRTLTDAKLAHRPVMDVQQCPHYPELFLAAYGSVGQTVQQRDQWGVFTNPTLAASQPGSAAGVVCVWSLAVPTRPEFTFTATSPVLSALFHSQDQHLVVGGCYSGQVLLWDMRAKSLPVQRSNLAGRGHKHPVFCMADADPAGAATTSGTGSHEIISASTDGMVCQWDLSRLSDPISASSVSFPSRPDGSVASGNAVTIDASGPSMKSANIACMAFGGRADGPRDVFLGTDMGKLVRTPLPIRANDPASQQVIFLAAFIPGLYFLLCSFCSFYRVLLC
jgi:dynein intermediate chain